MALGEELINQVKSRIQAVISQNRRDEIRQNIYIIALISLISWFIVEVTISVWNNNKISYSYTTHAEMVKIPEEKVAEAEVGKLDSSTPRAEYGDEVAIQTPQIEDLIRKTFKEEADIALSIARCESSLNPNAIGDQKIAYKLEGKDYGTSHGIFQVRHLPGRPEPSQLHDPKFNIEYAKTIKEKQGWYAWKWCYENKVLKKI